MMRLYDARTGELTPARPGGRLLRLSVAGLSPAGPGLADLRALLTGDLIRRLAELRRMVVLLAWDTPPDPAPRVRYDAACAALGLRPPGGDEGRAGIQVGGTTAGPGVWVRPGPVHLDGPGELALEQGGLDGLKLDDPLALRLALLERPYREPADLTAAGLAEAAASLAAWRQQVADWATHPSQRMSAEYEERVLAALEADLDAPAALAILRELAGDDQVAPGARFETVAHLDQLTGLDLARDVGR
jgi:hypothetical protein